MALNKEPGWHFTFGTGTKWYDHEIAFYKVPNKPVPGQRMSVFGWVFGESAHYWAFGLWLYYGKSARCVFATSLNTIYDRQYNLSILRKQYDTILARNPSV